MSSSFISWNLDLSRAVLTYVGSMRSGLRWCELHQTFADHTTATQCETFYRNKPIRFHSICWHHESYRDIYYKEAWRDMFYLRKHVGRRFVSYTYLTQFPMHGYCRRNEKRNAYKVRSHGYIRVREDGVVAARYWCSAAPQDNPPTENRARKADARKKLTVPAAQTETNHPAAKCLASSLPGTA